MYTCNTVRCSIPPLFFKDKIFVINRQWENEREEHKGEGAGGRGGAVGKEEGEGERGKGRRVGKVGSWFLGLGCFFLYIFLDSIKPVWFGPVQSV